MLIRLTADRNRLGKRGETVAVSERLGNALICEGVAEVVKRDNEPLDIHSTSFVREDKPTRKPRRKRKPKHGNPDQRPDSIG